MKERLEVLDITIDLKTHSFTLVVSTYDMHGLLYLQNLI